MRLHGEGHPDLRPTGSFPKAPANDRGPQDRVGPTNWAATEAAQDVVNFTVEKRQLEEQQARLTHDLKLFSEKHIDFNEMTDVQALRARFDELIARQAEVLDLLSQPEGRGVLADRNLVGEGNREQRADLRAEVVAMERQLREIRELFDTMARDAGQTPLERGVEQFKVLEHKIRWAQDEIDAAQKRLEAAIGGQPGAKADIDQMAA